MHLGTVYRKIRQMTFPPEFRIETDWNSQWERSAATALSQCLKLTGNTTHRMRDLQRQLDETQSQPGEPQDTAADQKDKGAFDSKFACAICNDIFRLQRNVTQLEHEGGSSKELRSIQRVVRNVDHALKENGIEYIDLTDKPFDERSEDFEPFGKPQEIPGLDRAWIAACERPVVLINGRIVQRARGVLKRPA